MMNANDASAPELVAVLDPGPDGVRVPRLVAADEPILTAFDLAATRGDGAFEAMLIRSGTPNKPDRHLTRMARSTQALDIVGPTDAEWTALVEALVAAWPSQTEGVLKLVVSRGREDGSGAAPTAYGTLVAIDDLLLRQRAGGVHVVGLTFGYPAHIRTESPWLLGGVKYLSYAVNMAAKRHAASIGADDVIFLSAEGDVLEGPNSTVVWLADGVLRTTPSDTGILRGTTQELLFETCDRLGLTAEIQTTTLDALHHAEAVWLCSSTRGIAEVHSIDGQPVATSDLTASLQELVGIPVSQPVGSGASGSP